MTAREGGPAGQQVADAEGLLGLSQDGLFPAAGNAHLRRQATGGTGAE